MGRPLGGGRVLAAEGYPSEYRKGDTITGLPLFPSDHVKVFTRAPRSRTARC